MGIGRMAIILVIDDYAESLDALANIIRNWGHEVIGRAGQRQLEKSDEN